MINQDAELIERTCSGDEAAFQVLLQRWHRPILNFLLKCTGNQDDAKELVQETFQTVFQKLDKLKDRERFSSWIYKIALNHSRMRQRKRQFRREESIEQTFFEGSDKADHYSALATNGAFSPEETFSRKEMEQVVRQALEKLNEKQREIIVLKEYSGLKFAEIAEIVDCPVSTVKSRMYIGMENLKMEILKIIQP